jgi:alkanesulfonate monooxygenase SsuD/methylene tetrahydromethanopterin reductase-like flavin-dependent oxidoreductase (luciferase family)
MSPRLDIFDNPSPGQTPAEVRAHRDARVDLAQHAETAGFLGVYVTEHPGCVGGSTPSALLEAVTLGLRTSRLQVGTAGIILPLRHPAAVAEEIAQADSVLGPGRIVAGLAKGFQPEVFHAHGRTMPTTAEYVAGVTTVLESLDGLGVDVEVMASASAASVPGVTMMVNPYGRGSRTHVTEEISDYIAAGGDEVFAHVMVHVDTCPDRARRTGRLALQRYLDAHGTSADLTALEAAGLVAIGDAVGVAAGLAWFVEAGVTRLGINPLLGYLEPEEAHRTVELLADDVLPLLDAFSTRVVAATPGTSTT